MECLPSFETTGGLVDAFPRDMLTAEDISQKRITMREVLEGYADTAAAPYLCSSPPPPPPKSDRWSTSMTMARRQKLNRLVDAD
eukprot:scaffold204416_cov31-Tisochrysis_lutea.AAC.1